MLRNPFPFAFLGAVLVPWVLGACGAASEVPESPEIASAVPTDTGGGAPAAWPVASGEPETPAPSAETGDGGARAAGPEVEAAVDAPTETARVEVRAGENLVLLAEQAGTSVEALCEANDLDPLAPLYPGAVIRVPLAVPEAVFAERRDALLAGRLDRYAARRGGIVGVSEHRVRTGETGWSIAREAGVAPWVLAAFNREHDLDHLRIGEVLLVPVYADGPVAAGD